MVKLSCGTGRIAECKFWYCIPRVDCAKKSFTLVKQK